MGDIARRKLHFWNSSREPTVGGSRWKEENHPLSKQSVKAERVSPITLFKEVCRAGNLGGNAGIVLVPMKNQGLGDFFYCQIPHNIDENKEEQTC